MSRSRMAAAAAALTAALVLLLVVLGGNEPPSPQITTTIPTATASAEEDLRTERPDDVPRAELDQAQEQQDALAFTDQLPLVAPGAAPEVPGCVSRFVSNYSSRRGVAPRLLVAHYTVSANRPGRTDVDAITDYFNRASSQASSHFVIDFEGHCNYIVRLTDKAWTQATFNPVSISIEFIATGKEGRLSPAAVAKGAQVFAEAARLFNIPARPGTISGCTVTRGGIVDHGQLGSCGGGHVDIRPFPLQPLITATSRRVGAVTSVDKVTCRKLNTWRQAGRPRGGPWESNSIRRRQALDARGVTCTRRGPVKTSTG